MFNQVIECPPKSKRPYFTVYTGTDDIDYVSADYLLLVNDGTQLDSGTVEGHDAPSSLSVRVWQSIDAQDADGIGTDLPAGCNVLELNPFIEGSDSITRHEQTRLVLWVPGRVEHTIFPTAADLQRRLVNQKMLSNPVTDANELLTDLDGYVAGAVDRWHGDTECYPWLAGVAEIRSFTPNGPDRPLQRASAAGAGVRFGGSDTLYITGTGLLSVTTLRVNKTASYAGDLLTEGTDFWLLRPDGASVLKPYTKIQFRTPPFGERNSIVINGVFGFQSVLSDDVWNAILDAATVEAIPVLERLQTGPYIKVKQENVEYTYQNSSGKGPFSDNLAMAESRYKSVLCRSVYRMKAMK